MKTLVAVSLFLISSLIKDTSADTETLLLATKTADAFFSPNYPSTYSLDETSRWKIRAPENQRILVSFLSGVTEECCDIIEMFENDESVARYSGRDLSEQSFLSSGNNLSVVFTSDGSLAFTGFLAFYQAVTCGYLLEVNATRILPQALASPGWPNQYNNEENCFWVLRVSPLKQIELFLREGNLRENDFVEIFDGQNSVGRFSGRIDSERFTSNTDIMRVNFRTDESGTSTGFIAEFRKLLCQASITATPEASVFSTPAYPFRPYPDDESCEWIIQAENPRRRILIVFEEGSTEDCCDLIEIFEGENSRSSETISGDIVPGRSFLSNGGSVRIVFNTDFAVNGPGFRATVEEVQCGFSLAVTSELQSLQYSSRFENCVWILTAEEGKQIQFRLNDGQLRGRESIEVFDGVTSVGRQTGNVERDIFVSSYGVMRVKLEGNPNFSGVRFTAQYEENCGTATFLTTNESTVVLQSPGYPAAYEQKVECTWVVSAPSLKKVQLTVKLDLNENSIQERVTVYDGRQRVASLRGNVNNRILVSTTGSFKITLTTNGLEEGQGFSIAATIAPCASSTLAPYQPAELTSPGWPQMYGNDFECEWTLRSDESNIVELTLHEVQTQSCCDYVEVFTGGESLGRFHTVSEDTTFSSGVSGSIVVRFFSDSSIVGNGFRATYLQRTSCRGERFVESEENMPINFPSSIFDRQTDCSMAYIASGGLQVLISLQLVTEDSSNYIKVYDNDIYVATIKSRVRNVMYASRTGKLRILIHSDGGLGFSVGGFYRRISTRRFVVATEDYNQLSLPNIVNDMTYPNNLYYLLRIVAPFGERIEIDIQYVESEECCDKLEIIEREQDTVEMSGTVSASRHISNGNNIQVRFQSDQSISSGRGFMLRYRQVSTSPSQ